VTAPVKDRTGRELSRADQEEIDKMNRENAEAARTGKR
jgi:hypothetical protein